MIQQTQAQINIFHHNAQHNDNWSVNGTFTWKLGAVMQSWF